MKKYNMPTMEISLFDAEVVSTSNEGAMSANLQAFNEAYNQALANGFATTIDWNDIKVIY